MAIRRTRVGEFKYAFDEATRTHKLTSSYKEYTKYGTLGFFVPTATFKNGDIISVNGKTYNAYTNDGNLVQDNFFVEPGIPSTIEENDKAIVEIMTDPESGNCYLNKLVMDKLNVLQFDDEKSSTSYEIHTDYVKIYEFDYVSSPSYTRPTAMVKIEVTIDNEDSLETYMTFKMAQDGKDMHMYPQASFRRTDTLYTIPFYVPLLSDETGLHHFELYCKVNDADVNFKLYKKNVRCILRGINVYLPLTEEGI